MSYGLIYTVPFASLHNEACIVEIEKEGYTGPSTELQAAGTPFTVEIGDEEFLYTPTRFSTATIRVVGSDYLQSLFSTAYQQYRVTFKKGDAITWCGFIKPELYTQDYSSEIFELELEAISAMSTLEYLDYKQSGEESRVFVSIWDLLGKCVAASLALYEAVYIPHVYATSATAYEAGENVLEAMTLSEQDFFDEDDKPMTLKEVLEEICKFLNWTCVDWQGSLYFVDVDHTGEYYKYSPDLERKIGTVSPSLIEIGNVGHAGSGHSLDILPGYNKVTVKCSNYPVGELTAKEDFDSLDTIDITEDVQENKKVSHKVILKPDCWDFKQYRAREDETLEPVSPEWVDGHKKEANGLMGAFPVKFCEYGLNDDGSPSITSYNYESGIQVRLTDREPPQSISGAMHYTPVLVVKGAAVTYSDGAFAISGQFRHCLNAAMGVVGAEDGWYAAPSLLCSLKIGDYRYVSSEKRWLHKSDPVMNDNIRVNFLFTSRDVAWFNIKDEKTLDMPYSGLQGNIIPVDTPITGEMEFTLYGSTSNASGATGRHEYGYFLKNFKLEFQKKDFSEKKEENSDRIYENVVNDSYINELDEIEFKISSYNNDGACYSKVMLGSAYLTDNLYSSVEGTAVRPEEHLIRRIIKRYGVTRIKLTQVIKEPPVLKPFDRLSDSFLVSKRFINAGGSIDYKMNRFECIMIEV